METLVGQSEPQAPAADLIKDSDMAGFADDVIRASMEVPVLVDFWAPWCGPCKQLGPLLEKVVTAAAGKVKLVKINVDENQAIAQQLRIQSIPAVFAFHNGQPVDGFVGALSESQIKEFIGRLAGGAIGPSPAEEALEAGQAALEAGDFDQAIQAFGVALQADPEDPAALGGLARCMVQTERLAEAREILDKVPAQHADHKDVAGARAALALAEESEAAADPAEIVALRGRLESNPDDHQARFDLSVALNAAEQREEAVDELLEIFRRNRGWNDEAARKQLLKLFEAWGPTDPVTLESRRKLSSLMFS